MSTATEWQEKLRELDEARAACAAMRRAIEPVLHCACSSCVDRLSEALSSTAGSELLARLEKAEAELAKLKAPKPEPKWCDICPHPLGLHNDDGSCGCGMDCQRERALKSKGGGA